MSRVAEGIKTLWARSMLHRALLVAPPVALLLLVGFWTYGSRQNTQFYTAKVEKGDISQVVQATGTINAVITVQVGSQVSGTISQLFADFNTRVKKNQVIAQIDPAILRAQLMQAEADLENALANVKSLEAQIDTQRANVQASKANVDRMRAQLGDAQLTLKRSRELFEQGIVPAAQRDTAQATYDGAVASVQVAEAQYIQSEAQLKSTVALRDQAKAQVEQRRAAAELARVNLANTTIRAPIDGTVVARNVDVGQTVAASLQAPTLFVIAQDLTKMLVYAKTDESDVGQIKIGATATFRVDSFPREQFSGRVIQVRMNATTIQNVVTYDTIIEFDNPDQKLFPGMTAYVNVPVAWENDVVKIPNGALRFKPDMSDDERRALFAKYGIPEGPQGSVAGRLGPGAPGKPGGQPSSGGPAGEGAPGVTPNHPPTAGNSRQDWGIVWKLLPNRTLQPVQVRLGVTDFTFTAMEQGSLAPGDELVISQATKGASPQSPGQQRSPVGGVPRRI